MTTRKPKFGHIPVQQPKWVEADPSQFQWAGISSMPTMQSVANGPTVEEPGLLRSVADTAVQFGQGAISGVRMMSDIFGADNAVSSGLRSANDALNGLLSASARQDQQTMAAILKEAEGKGWTEQIAAGLKAFGVDPVGILAQAVGTSIPTLATAFIPGAGPAALAARTAAGAAIGAAQGAGNIKGEIYETTKRELLAAGATPEEAERRAVEAQSYEGANKGQIALGGGLGALAGTTGAERMVGALRHGIGKKAAESAPGMLSRVATGALTEAVPEGLQGGQEKYATNTALINEGFTVDPWSGVVAQGTMEATAGSLVGGGLGIPSPALPGNPDTNPPEEDPAKKAANAIRQTEKVPESGPLTRAVNQGVEAKAQRVEDGAVTVAANELSAAAQARLKELEEKGKGTKDQKVKGPEGQDVTIPGKPAEFLTDVEKQELDFLKQNAGNPQALAQRYGVELAPEGVAPPVEGTVPPAPAAPAEPVEIPVAEASERDQALYEQAMADEAAREAELERQAIQAENEPVSQAPVVDDLDPPFDEPVLNPSGQPFKTKMAADRKAKELGAGYAAVQTTGGWIVVNQSPEVEAQPEPEQGLGFKEAFDSLANGGVTEDFYNKAYEALRQGSTTISGVKDPLLQRAKPAFDAGLIAGPQDIRKFEESGYPEIQPTEQEVNTAAIEQPKQPAETAAAPEPAEIEQPAELPAAPAAGGTDGVEAVEVEGPESYASPSEQVATAAEQWARMSTVDREALGILAGMKTRKAAELTAKKAWDQIDPVIQQNLVKAMQPKQAKTAPAETPAPAIDLRGRKSGDTLNIANGTQYRIEGIDQKTGKVRAVRNPNMLSERTVLLGQDEFDRLVADHDETAAEAKAQQPAQPTPEKPLGEQLAKLNDELERQGPVQNANTRAKRDQIRRLIAEQDFPKVLKAVDDDIDTAEAINRAIQYAGDEPKAKVIERTLKSRGITPEYQKRWTGRLLKALGEDQPAKDKPEVSANTIFTEDAAAKARERLRKKLFQLNSGLDPEMMMDGITLAGYHIERGARTFAAYAKAMIDDLGEVVKPYLKSWYMGVKFDPRAAEFSDSMDDAATVEKADIESLLAPKQDTAPAAKDDAKPSLNGPEGRFAIAQSVADHLIGGNRFATIVEARKFIADLTGQKIEPGTKEAKLADETVELGVVLAARDIVKAARKQGRSDQVIYDRLVSLYNAQPNLAVRSSTSVREQAYSTPVPLAFLASRLANVKAGDKVLEPTAGNGALVLEVAQSNAIVNELNPDRLSNLRAIGFEPTNKNAATEPLVADGQTVDAQIMNPPFGATKDANGETIYYEPLDGVNYSTREVDHAIALNSLKSLKDDGMAVLIVGGVDARSDEERANGYRGKNKREFYFHLYQNYKVVDHFTVDGDLYARQGAAYPVDVIVIQGRGKATRPVPQAQLPEVFTSWDQLKGKLDEAATRSVESAQRPGGTVRSDGGTRGTDGTTVAGRPGGQGEPTGGQGRPAGLQGSDAVGVEGMQSAVVGRPDGVGTVSGDGQLQPAGEPVGGDERLRNDVPRQGQSRRQSEAQGSAGRDGLPDVAGDSRLDGQRLQSGISDRRGQETETKTQVAYEPRSSASSVGTLVPVSMRDAVQESLSRVEKAVGNLDEYVGNALGFDPEELRANFSAEQVDALALSIYNAENGTGFIIGDQTGIGKGRVVAAMIRYALRQGKTPIFVTEKPNLYADMIRDLDDIGMAEELQLESDPLILMTNDENKIEYTLLRNVNGEVVENHIPLKPPKERGKKLEETFANMRESGDIGKYKVVFTTYNQLQTVKGKETERMKLVQALANDGYVIFDESHNAGGAGETQARTKEQRAAASKGETLVTGRAAFARQLVRNAFGTFFSSATYAKRPDVMDLYSSTNMMLAVNRPADLAPAIKEGGVPLQQTVAAMLTRDGQYIRRERTFAGVSYDTRKVKVDIQTAENMAASMRRILEFSRAKEAAVKNVQKEEDANSAVVRDMGGEKTQVQGANFGSIMHNLIDQMLLALKAHESVQYAIERVKAGEKVVLTVSNTMGSFLKDFADEMGLRAGDPISLSFKDLYLRYLEKQRYITIKRPGGDSEKRRLTDEELGPGLVKMFADIQGFIENAGFGSAPISPIDYMHQELRKAGLRSDEITGRNMVVSYDQGVPKLGSRKNGIRERLQAISGFNSGELDVLILNQSGSTGLSLHASSKFKDQRKRHMMIVQAEKNIDTHMQMLGRVHRTGQVMPPAYTQMMADVPAEMRPAAILAKKMASLNANTTASRESAVSQAEGVVDFMNDYGGQVAIEFLADNPDVHEALGGNKVLELMEDTTEATEDHIRKLTGYIPILPIKQQETVYADLIDRYNELIARENSMGTNKLEAKALDLDAKTITSETVTPQKEGDSEFAKPAFMEQVDVKRTVKPYTKAEVEAQVAESLKGKSAQQVANDLLTGLNEKAKAFLDDETAKLKATEADNVTIERKLGQYTMMVSLIRTVLNNHKIGDSVSITDASGNITYAVITDMRQQGKTKNPAAGSDWKMTLALANGDAKSLTIGFNQVGTRFKLREEGSVPFVHSDGKVTFIPIKEVFDQGGNVRREKRWMVTGNILAAFSQFRGQIVNYTKEDGTIAQGVLMSRSYDYAKVKEKKLNQFTNAQQVFEFLSESYNGVVGTQDWHLRIFRRNGSTVFSVSSSKRDGGTYFLDKKLTEAIGSDFYKAGSRMEAHIWDGDYAQRGVEYLMSRDDVVLSALSDQKTARKVLGLDQQPKAPEVPFSRAKANAKGISEKAANGIVSAIRERWSNAPEIVVVQNMQDARVPQEVRDYDAQQKRLGAKGEPEGFFHRGKVYVVAGSLNTPSDVIRVLFHETLGHAGLRGVFGEQLKPILQQIVALRRKEVEAVAKRYGLDMTKEGDRLQAAEEVLANMAQTKPELGYVQRAIAAIRAFLRKNIPGFQGMKLTDAEIIQQYILPARRFIERGPQGGPSGGTRFSRSNRASDQTMTPEFKRWFGDSKVVDEQGRPLVVYHGTNADFSEFDPEAQGSSGQGSGEPGFFFEASPDNAARYTRQGGGANVMPVYLSLKNPLIVERTNTKYDYDGSYSRVAFANFIDDALELGHDGVIFRDVLDRGKRSTQYVAFQPEQIKSAIGNNGQFDPTNPDIRFSRTASDVLESGVNAARNMPLPAGYIANDFMESHGKVGWWHKTVGTMYNLAQRRPEFKRVFDAAQNFLNDVSYYATEAANLAPNILPKLEKLKDITKSPLTPEDNKAIAAPIFEGTLVWMRDPVTRKAVRMEDVEARAAKMAPADKAQELLRKRLLAPEVLRMWQGLPLDKYNALVNGKYERELMKPGIVFTDAELKDLYKLNDRQISLYREFRKAVDKSLSDMALTDMARYAGKDIPASLRLELLEAQNVYAMAKKVRNHLHDKAKLEADEGRKQVLIDTGNKILNKAAQVEDLIQRGYAPLSRFGSHAVDVVDANGDRVYFGLFESKAEANKMARKMRANYPDATIAQGTVSQEQYRIFAGVSPETVELFGEMLGLEGSNVAFQQYIKLAKANRSAMKRLIQRKGIAGFSEDPGRVLAGFVYSNARQASANVHMGELTESVAAIPQNDGELKDVAVRLAEYVKNPIEEAQQLRGILFAQYLGGNISSAVLNAMQSIQVTFPWLSQHTSITNAAKLMTKAMKDVAGGGKIEDDLAKALLRAEESGIVSPQEVFHLQAQAAGRAPLAVGDGTFRGNAAAKANNALSKVMLAWGKLFSVAEQFNRRAAFVAAYRLAKSKGMAEPAKFAEMAVNETQFIYNKGNRPNWARGALGATLFTFKSYSVSYIELMHRLYTQGGPDGKKAALLGIAMLFVLSGAGGLPFMEDLDDLIDGFMQRVMNRNFSSKQAKEQFFRDLLGEGGADFVMRGVTGLAGSPVALHGRFGLGNLIPGTGVFQKKDNYGRDLLEIVGPAGDFFQRALDATGKALQGDVTGARGALATISPTAARNAIQGYEMATTGMYLDQKGRKVIDVDGTEAMLKSIGLQPQSVGKVQESVFEVNRQIQLNKLRESEIADKWAKGIFLKDKAMVEEARKELKDWNKANPHAPIMIQMPQIIRRVRQMSMSKSERLAKTAPKEIRAQVGQQLAEAQR